MILFLQTSKYQYKNDSNAVFQSNDHQTNKHKGEPLLLRIIRVEEMDIGLKSEKERSNGKR
ncbi:hypothetical protein [Enterococcus sp. S22(2020)]|uniref:hypothetical protein n=1 Tax=Enterococcus sp. S22(2020) TaxID=2759151 RepID=UPI001CE1681B|nr:hypothetical protein [Enterococcus sp. S22(2020)]